ncbi:MAG: hypothetical protein KJ550_02005, partial [Proteobacteria bacterium]|nr:hypothetical protein [Pseudomonadota bacterium]MBU4068986.1 hypothetical protein [Pseudomonadota bacterium]
FTGVWGCEEGDIRKCGILQQAQKVVYSFSASRSHAPAWECIKSAKSSCPEKYQAFPRRFYVCFDSG